MPLLSYNEYNKLGKFNLPLTLVLRSRGGEALYYFGEEHSYDPNHKQWDVQRDFFKSFAKETSDRKRVIFTEGGCLDCESTEADSIKKYSGMGLAVFLAKKEGIEVYSPEPKWDDQINNSLKEFTRDQIFLFYCLRRIYSKKEFREEIISDIGNIFKKTEGWSDYNFSFQNFLKIYQDVVKRDFIPDDMDYFGKLVRPNTNDNEITNKISSLVSQSRDRSIVQKIKDYIDNGYSIYIQMGFTHLVIQEPALREFLG